MISTSIRTAGRPVAVLDLDGTVALGDGPARAYAEEAFARMDAAQGMAASAAFAAWMAGETQDVHADAYSAVARLAAALPAQDLQEAYLASRRRLERESLGESTPARLRDALAIMRGADMEIVLLTNSPEVGIGALLGRLGLEDAFDQVVVDAGKPARIGEHMAVLLGEQPPHRLLSIGDHHANDIAPVIAAGGVGMLITGSWGRGTDAEHPAHASAPTFDALLPAISDYCADIDGVGTAATIGSPDVRGAFDVHGASDVRGASDAREAADERDAADGGIA
ncbi:HAD family hydrolase [Brachybacterium sp. DNPG3]